jgi:hypothetical protein
MIKRVALIFLLIILMTVPVQAGYMVLQNGTDRNVIGGSYTWTADGRTYSPDGKITWYETGNENHVKGGFNAVAHGTITLDTGRSIQWELGRTKTPYYWKTLSCKGTCTFKMTGNFYANGKYIGVYDVIGEGTWAGFTAPMKV